MTVGFILLAAAFAISAVWMLLANSNRAERVLFFPGQIDPALQGESRVVPRHGDTERDIEVLISEIFLGPADLSRTRVVDRQSRVNAVIVREHTVYIDISPETMFLQQRLPLSLEEAFSAIEHTIGYNFRGIHNIVFTVGGQLPHQPYFEV